MMVEALVLVMAVRSEAGDGRAPGEETAERMRIGDGYARSMGI